MLRKPHLTSPHLTSMAVAVALGVSSMASVPAYAQGEADAATLEEVVVTGSRIQKANLVSSSPVTQVTAEEIAFQGTVRVEDMLRTLPQVYSDQNTTQSNGATGTATINLRNLGAERTLVLVNGRRMPAGSPLQGGIGADINQIPGALIKSVEVLTGGASATYGSDAVAGVVNFLMVDDFQGVKLDYQFSQYNHNNDNDKWQDIIEASGYPVADGSETDGDMSDISLIIGGNIEGGRGNVTAYATYRDIDPVLQSARDYSGCALSNDLTTCFGSSTIPQGRFTDFGTEEGFDYITAGTNFQVRAGETFNYGPLNYYQRPDERYTFGAFARYEVNEHVEAYSELMFMDDRTVSQIAPSGNFFRTDELSCGNAFLSAQQFNEICGQHGYTTDDTRLLYIGRRNVEGGNRQQDLRHDSFRGVFGLRGDINDTWRYDLYYQYSEVTMANTYLNDLNVRAISRALDAVVDPDTGDITCASVLDGSDPNCVPWNIFETGAVTQAMTDYLALPLFARGTTDQTVMSAYVAGSLGDYGIKLPWAETGIDIVLGTEYREENLDFNPDNGFRQGHGAGQGGATGPTRGGYDVTEFFAEVSIPLIEGMAFAEEVTLDGGYRYSDYDYDEETNTYGVRLGWAFNQQIKARASFQRAIRGPNIQELFLPQGLNLFDMNEDPCGGPVTNGLTARGYNLDQCARSGVTADQFGRISHSPAGQYNFLQGGNTELSPEEADTYSFGLVFTPDFVDGLTLTVDYYDITIEDGINNLTPEFIILECIEGNVAQCPSVQRGNSGDLWIGSDPTSGHVIALNDNLAIEEVKGYDIIADYVLDIGDWGSLNFNNVMAYIDTWDQTELKGATPDECKGNWGGVCGYPTPELQNNFRMTWTTPWDVTASLMWRYVDEVTDLNIDEKDLDSQDYFDLAAIWDVTDYATIRAGVNNLTDEEPPIVGSAAGPQDNGNGNTFPGAYDALGRYWFIGASVGF